MSTFTYDDDEYPLPTGDWTGRTTKDQFRNYQEIRFDITDEEDEAKQLEKLKKIGFISRRQFDCYFTLITEKVDGDLSIKEELLQEAMDKQTGGFKKQMNDNAAAMANSEVMAPISGVTLEQYAMISSQLAQGTNYADLLKKQGIESVSWEKAAEGWAERMRTDTTFTVVNEYSKFFMAAGQGQFGDTAKEVADDMSGGKIKSDSPVSLELFAEISAAQSAGVAQGKDASAILAGYGLNAADWGTIGGHWGGKMMSDMNVAIKFSELLTQFTEKFSAEAPSAAGDIDF